MVAKPVQISMDTDLLRRVDRDPEAREKGRSAFVSSAIELYLTAKQRREVEARIAHAYEGAADDMLEEISDFMESQSWPES